jgi:hypothetical protein
MMQPQGKPGDVGQQADDLVDHDCRLPAAVGS